MLTNEDLLAISQLLDVKLHPMNERLDEIEFRHPLLFFV